MKNVLAIARLTFWEGIRMRIVVIFLVTLGLIVLRLPFALKGDETVAGRLQTFLSYSLGAVSTLLGLACVFLSSWTLTSDIKSNTIHMLVTKPVSRLQILLGKWLGINLLMLALVLLCGGVIYGFACFIKSRPVTFQRDEINIRDVVWRARVAATPRPIEDFKAKAKEWVESQVKQGQVFSRGEDYAVAERVKELINEWRKVDPGEMEGYLFENLIPPRNPGEAVQVRYRARGVPLPPQEMLGIEFAFGDPDQMTQISGWHLAQERSGDLHQFLVNGQGVVKNGRSLLVVRNPEGQRSSIVFDLDKWLTIMYNISSFEENYAKTLAIIFGRLAFLSAVGLFFGVFTSFPVACMCAATFYVICLGMPFWLESIGANLEFRTDAVDPYGKLGPAVRLVLVPLMKVAFPNFSVYDGTAHLIDGEYISMGLLAKSLAHTLLYGIALLLGPGWLVFRSREIAQVTV